MLLRQRRRCTRSPGLFTSFRTYWRNKLMWSATTNTISKRTAGTRYGVLLTAALLLCSIIGVGVPAQAQTYQVIYNFTDGRDGANPSAGVSIDRAGKLYGTTTHGGEDQFGTIYRLTRSSGGQW